MDRRTFIKTGIVPLTTARAWAQAGDWRTFEVTTRVEIQKPSGITRAWIPLAYAGGAHYQRVVTERWRGNAPVLRALRDAEAGILFAEWPDGEPKPEVELTLTVATRDRATEWRDRTVRAEPERTLRAFLSPVSAAARATAARITRNEADDVARARAIYEWVIDHEPGPTRSDAFVALARAARVPARRMSGLRLQSGDVTTAQSERAEFHSSIHGWVPVDPTGATDAYARRQLFGSWMGAWVAFNHGFNLRLPSAADSKLSSLAHPHAETAGLRLDSRAPDELRYRITARQLE